MAEIDVATLRQLLRYEPETGKLYWLPRPVEIFVDSKQSASHIAANWNSRFAGKEAFTANAEGYRHGAIFHRNYKAHRVVWAIVHGKWPTADIDHINGDRADNRICNLRAVSRKINLRNAALSARNKSGACGVSWFAERNKWRARVVVDRRDLHLGLFDNFEDAVAARKAAQAHYGFHKNHGRAR